MKKIIPLILLLISSCKSMLYNLPDPPAYIANVSNVNCNAERNDSRASFFLGGNHAEAQATFNITDNHAVQFNTYQGFAKRFVLNELAYSQNFPVLDDRRVNLTAGYGYGTLTYNESRDYSASASSYAPFFEKKYDIRSFLHRVYIQPAYVFENFKGTKFMMSTRLSGILYPVYYYNLTETKQIGSMTEVLKVDSINAKNKLSWVLDPAFTIVKQGKYLGVYMQCQFTVPLSRKDVYNEHHLIDAYFPLLSLGLTLNIDGAFRKD